MLTLIPMRKVKTDTYFYADGFMVDIVELKCDFEAYLYHKDYGTKAFMFGAPVKSEDGTGISKEAFIEMVEDALAEHSLIDIYVSDYMD